MLAEIQKRRAAGDAAERKDILSMLLLARNEQGEGLTDAEVRDELTTLVLAGHETTGTALAWALECLLQRPAVVRRIREEMAQVAGRGEVPRSREALAKLEYLDAVIKEVLRFRPIMAFGGTRVLQASVTLRELRDSPRASAVANASQHGAPAPRPLPRAARVPPRALRRQEARPLRVDCPSAAESRRCLGMAFALYEMKIVLARLLSTVELELADAGPIRPVTRGFFIAPAKGLPVRVKSRAAATAAA